MPSHLQDGRTRRRLIVFLIDQSASMEDGLISSSESAKSAVARFLDIRLRDAMRTVELQAREADRPDLRDNLDVVVLGYRTDTNGDPLVSDAFVSPPRENAWASIAEISTFPSPCIASVAEGGTPTCAAFHRVVTVVAQWIERNPAGFAPVLLHITDGESCDGDPKPFADEIRSLATTDGPVSLFHAHLAHVPGEGVLFPTTDEVPGDALARTLFSMSSLLSELTREAFGVRPEVDHSAGARGLVFNAGLFEVDLILRLIPFFSGDWKAVAPDAATASETPPVVARSEVRTNDRAVRSLEPSSSTRTSSTPPAPQTQPPVDENVQFTSYCPRTVKPEKFYTILAFAHLEELPPDAPDDAPDPQVEVRDQAERILGKDVENYRASTQESAQSVPRETEITFVLEIDGFRCNPARQTIFWEESVHRVEFRIKAPASLDGRTCRGRLSIFLGDIPIAQALLRIDVRSQLDTTAATRPQRTDVKPYRKIFASYSHRDTVIVEQFERYAAALGDRYLRDTVELRAGELWNDRLMEMIREADVFQLFWSSNSMHSDYVQQEYEYAMSLGRQNFVRPLY